MISISGRRGVRRKLLLHSGNIRTLDPRHPSAQAMIIDGPAISWIGNNDEIVGIPVDEYAMLNLAGKTIMPSFGDAHVHFAHLAQSLANLDLSGCKSYGEVLKRTEDFARGLSKNEWLIGRGWKKDEWTDTRLPQKRDLDLIAPNNPAAIYSKDEHMYWTNSLGLKKAGIDRMTPDPEGGIIEKDETGELTGILMENACALLNQQIGRRSKSKALKLIERAIGECHRCGVTAIGNFDDIGNFELLQEYHKKVGLKIRVRQYIPIRFLDNLLDLNLKSGFGDRYLNIAGTKTFADGSLGSQTACMFEPYKGNRHNVGIEVTDQATLTELVRRSASGGLACAVHAIGDRANHQVLNAFAGLPKKHRTLRHRIEHVQIIRDEDIPRFAQLGVIASMQPSHCSSDIDLMARYLGKRSNSAYSFRSIIDSGARVAFGSDAPIEKLDPFRGVYSAIARRSPDGGRRHRPDQRISVGEAFAGFISGVAYALGDENLFGVIAPGRSADIIVMEEDPFRARIDTIKDIDVFATFFEGECVFGGERLTE